MKNRLLSLIAIVSILFANSIYGQNFVDVTKSNNGQTINLSTDQVLEVKLPRISSAGYTWCESITSTDKTIQQSIAQIGNGDFIPDAGSGTFINKKGRMVGQSGTQILRYVGASQGTTVLTLELRRPWEKNNPAIDNYTITVVSGGKYTGNYTPTVKEKPKHITSTPKSVPSKWDWRSQCTPIGDQQQCGDCWAFAGVGVLECNIKITDSVTRDISEAYLTNCDTAYFGCNGGGCPLDYWLAPKGAVYESDYPWTTSLGNGTTGTCGGPFTYHETIKSYAYVPGENANDIPPDANMKDAIYNYGPIWVGVAASNAWSSYTGGIFTESDTSVDHAVVLVGWVDSAAVSGGGYWILRNSWGASWGINGYMYISYGSDAVGTYAAYIVYKGKDNDFQMLDITYPLTNCGYTNVEYISAQIKYNGDSVVIPAGDTLPVAYRADGGAIKNDTIILLNPMSGGDTLDFTFHSTADFSALGIHTISCRVKYKNDTLALNDSINGYTFENKMQQNIDVGVCKINGPVSTCHMTNAEPVDIDVKFYGCDSLASGETIVLAYSVNGGYPVRDTIQIPYTIMPNGTFNHVFTNTNTADLSAPGSYTIVAWTEYNPDTLHANDMFCGYVVKNPSNIGFDTIGFEEPDINSLILIETAHYSHAWVSATAHNTGTKGLQMTGGNFMDYIDIIQIPITWNNDEFLSAKANFCVDATGWASANMRFDLKQTNGGDLYTQYQGPGDYTKASNLRILVNGVQIGGTYNPTDTHNDPWVTHFINIDSMAGKQFTVTIETRNFAKDTSIIIPPAPYPIPFVLDNAYIDNVCFSPMSQQDVEEYNPNLSLGVYPNPFNDGFTVKFDADCQEIVLIEITDLLGRFVSKQLWNIGIGTNRTDVNLNDQPSGMYLLKLRSSKGFAVKSIVKQ
ncbi:MAG: C1 family peptidase [Bacteroidales bacterium]